MLLTAIFFFKQQFGEKKVSHWIQSTIKNLIEINKLTLQYFKLVI